MTRRGPIRAEEAERRADRDHVELALWERGPGRKADLPWLAAADIDADSLAPLLERAQRVVLAIGTPDVSLALLDIVLGVLRRNACLYVYADRQLEKDRDRVKRLRRLGDRALVRLGARPPADWLVVDSGRDGRLVVGPDAESRRWMIPVSSTLARSLFEAFRVLFWHRSAREALPDDQGRVAFREPLPAPEPDPGDEVHLPAGRLVCNGVLPDPIADAEMRLAPKPTDPGSARRIIVPPRDPQRSGGRVVLDLPMRLAEHGREVVWIDSGLPSLTISHQRAVMDLVDAPHALQLEWGQKDAIDLLHRLDRAASEPAWRFHQRRRLGDIGSEVLLDGHSKAQSVVDTQTIEIGDVVADLRRFGDAEPEAFPDPGPLARSVVYRWRRVPPTAPAGARPARLARQWVTLDEWASRRLDDLRDELGALDEQTSGFARLLGRFWRARRDEHRVRRSLEDRLDELGDAPPSQVPDEAADRISGIEKAAEEIEALRRGLHSQRQSAEDEKAEAEQRAAWETERAELRTELKALMDSKGQTEAAIEEAEKALADAEGARDEWIETLRAERASTLDIRVMERESEVEAALEAERQLDADLAQKPSRKVRKEVERKLKRAKSGLERAQAERAGLDDWRPPANELADVQEAVDTAKQMLAERQSADAKRIEQEATLRARLDVAFAFERPKRLPAPRATAAPVPPPVPEEAPPEIGTLLEHQGKRYLAIETWPQVRPSLPVAERLGAELVVTREGRR